MREIRLNRAASVPDYDRQTEYVGPGTFELDDDVAEEYLQKDMWEPGDAFDADEFLSASKREIVNRMTTEGGAVRGKWDDKLAELYESEVQGDSRPRVIDLLQERSRKSLNDRREATTDGKMKGERVEIGKLSVIGEPTKENPLHGSGTDESSDAADADENPYEEQ
jgi:hypothetical protein